MISSGSTVKVTYAQELAVCECPEYNFFQGRKAKTQIHYQWLNLRVEISSLEEKDLSFMKITIC